MNLLSISFACSNLVLLLSAPSSVFALNKIKKKQIRSRRTKQAKGPKASTSVYKKKPDSLVALIENHSELTESDVFGKTTLRYNIDGSILVSVDIGGLATSEGSVTVVNGMTCDQNKDFGYLYDESPRICGESGIAGDKIQTLGDGVNSISRSAFRIDNGCTKEENIGQAIIIADSHGSAVACGILGEEAKEKVLVADMSSYPGYTGSLTPSGKVTVAFNDDDTFTFSYDVSGLKEDCIGCGIHIHAGTSCATIDGPLGHGWNSVVVQDLWTAAGGATYASDNMGNAKGYFSMTNRFGYEVNANHAVVIHTQDGSRVACGVLN